MNKQYDDFIYKFLMYKARERIKALIILSRNTEEADKGIVKILGNVSTKEKIAFLRGMFDVQIISRCGQTNNDTADYEAMLGSILAAARES